MRRVIDVATRVIAGFYLSLDAPSAASVALGISHAVVPKGWQPQSSSSDGWPVAGLPKLIHLDKAKEFHNLALERGCREHQNSVKFCPLLTSHFGGPIERLIGTLMVLEFRRNGTRLYSLFLDIE